MKKGKMLVLISSFLVVIAHLSCSNENYDTALDNGAYLIGQGEFTLALVQLDKAINAEQSSYEPYKYKSLAYYGLGNIVEANNFIDKAIELGANENDLELLLIKGTLLDELNDTIGAILYFSKSISKDSNCIDGLYKRAWLLTRFKDYNSAYDDFNRVKTIDSTVGEVNMLIEKLEARDFEYFEKENYGDETSSEGIESI